MCRKKTGGIYMRTEYVQYFERRLIANPSRRVLHTPKPAHIHAGKYNAPRVQAVRVNNRNCTNYCRSPLTRDSDRDTSN